MGKVEYFSGFDFLIGMRRTPLIRCAASGCERNARNAGLGNGLRVNVIRPLKSDKLASVWDCRPFGGSVIIFQPVSRYREDDRFQTEPNVDGCAECA